ncbi:MAG: glycosyltransferase family 39 protein [Bacteroidetes bacterium]|nr:glycosyltransferase family 39 protein [Bacteroidota bacterium]
MNNNIVLRLKEFFNENILLVILALVKLFIHLAVNITGGYGIFRDEFYYLACAENLDWGYVDQPPFSILMLLLNRLFFGDSLFAIRLLPSIIGAVVVFLAGLITKELGGKKFAQVLAAISVITAPQILGTNANFSMNSFDIVFWTLAIYLIVRIMKEGNPKQWLWLGIVIGLGLLNKISVLWLGAGIFTGLILTPGRKLFLTRRVWTAAGVALLIFLPYIIWEAVYGFPTLEFMKNAISNKYAEMSPLKMLFEQILHMNPITFPIWISGLFYFLTSKATKQFRILPIIYFTVLLILIINRNSKSEYLGPVYPMLFALGSFTLENFITRYNWKWLKPVYLAILVAGGIVLAPFAIAVLPVETFISYSRTLGITPSTTEKKEVAKLPQYYADMFGWEEMTAEIAKAYNTLTPEEKSKCAIFFFNYGEAGAIDYYGRIYGLPKAICSHNNYWLWGPRGATGEIVIRLGRSKTDILKTYKEANQVGFFFNEYCMPYENNLQVFICRDRRIPMKDEWVKMKNYD